MCDTGPVIQAPLIFQCEDNQYETKNLERVSSEDIKITYEL